jgi:hypothetical protein
MAEGDVNANVVQAKHFQLVDDNNVLAQLGAGPNGSSALEFYKSDTPRVSLGMDPTGRVSLSLRDNAGTIGARLAVDSSGSPAVFTIRDAPERVRAQVALDQDGGVGITLVDQSGAKRISLETHADGASYVAVYDEHGNPVNALVGELPED